MATGRQISTNPAYWRVADSVDIFDAARVSYLYSLYDALVSIAVPADKARAVVDAMEHDMGTTLATKPDLENLRLATKADLENLRLATRQELELLRRDMENGFGTLRRDMESGLGTLRRDMENSLGALRHDMDSRFALVDEKLNGVAQKVDGVKSDLELKIGAQEFRMVAKLGSMMVLGFGLVLAALSAWG